MVVACRGAHCLVFALLVITRAVGNVGEEETVLGDVEAIAEANAIGPWVARRAEALEGASELQPELSSHGEILGAADQVQVYVRAIGILEELKAHVWASKR